MENVVKETVAHSPDGLPWARHPSAWEFQGEPRGGRGARVTEGQGEGMADPDKGHREASGGDGSDEGEKGEADVSGEMK